MRLFCARSKRNSPKPEPIFWDPTEMRRGKQRKRRSQRRLPVLAQVILCLPLGLGSPLAFAQSGSSISAVVSAASDGPSVAPGSIATLFGTSLASSAVVGTPDSQGNLPLNLGGVSVLVAGIPASLFYVSPTQINFLIPSQTPVGQAAITVTTSSGSTVGGVATVVPFAPAIFVLGSSRGAVENAATGSLEPFDVTDPAMPDGQTRLSLFATGLNAANPTGNTVEVYAQSSTLGSISLKVEYAGPQGYYLGLDQINVVLPAALNGAGDVQVFVQMGPAQSNSVLVRIRLNVGPTIGSVSANSGPPLAQVAISGSGFAPDNPGSPAGPRNLITFEVDGQPATSVVPDSATASKLLFHVPYDLQPQGNYLTGAYTLCVTTDGRKNCGGDPFTIQTVQLATGTPTGQIANQFLTDLSDYVNSLSGNGLDPGTAAAVKSTLISSINQLQASINAVLQGTPSYLPAITTSGVQPVLLTTQGIANFEALVGNSGVSAMVSTMVAKMRSPRANQRALGTRSIGPFVSDEQGLLDAAQEYTTLLAEQSVLQTVTNSTLIKAEVCVLDSLTDGGGSAVFGAVSNVLSATLFTYELNKIFLRRLDILPTSVSLSPGAKTTFQVQGEFIRGGVAGAVYQSTEDYLTALVKDALSDVIGTVDCGDSILGIVFQPTDDMLDNLSSALVSYLLSGPDGQALQSLLSEALQDNTPAIIPLSPASVLSHNPAPTAFQVQFSTPGESTGAVYANNPTTSTQQVLFVPNGLLLEAQGGSTEGILNVQIAQSLPPSASIQASVGGQPGSGSPLTFNVAQGRQLLIAFQATKVSPGTGSIVSYTWLDGLTQIGVAAAVNVSLAAGLHHISCIIQNSSGLSSATEIDVFINSPTGPTVHFSMQDSAGATMDDGGSLTESVVRGAQAQVVFQANVTSTEAIASYTWSIDGTAVGNTANASASLAAGSHNVGLVVTDSLGAKGSATASINVVGVGILKAAFNFSGNGQVGQENSIANYQIAPGGTVPLSMWANRSQGAASYSWNLDSAVFSQAETAAASVGPGSHTISLTVGNGVGVTDTATATVIVAQTGGATAPMARLSLSAQNQTAGNNGTISLAVPTNGSVTVAFDGSASSAGSGTLAAFQWLSNGVVISTQPAFSLTITTASNTITLKVTNSNGLSGTASAQINLAIGQSGSPTAITGLASEITSTSATLGGTANPNGLDTHYWFLYGTNSSLSGAAQTGTYDMGAGTSALTITANAPGLSANTTYYYRLQAQNSAGTSSGNILTFSASAVIPPTPTGLSPGGSSPPGTTVNTLTPTLSWSASSGATQYSVAVLNVSTGATVVAQTVSTTSLTSSALQNSVTYTWNVSATNSAGTSAPSTGVYFTVSVAVPQEPTVSTGAASAVTSDTASLGGTVNPNGLSTQVWFQYSTNNSLSAANQTPSQSVGSGSSALPISANIASLSANTTYYYRLQAQNSAGTNSGSILNFATSAAVPPTPTGLSPGGSSPPGSTVNTLTPTLSWSASSGATQYSVAVLNVSTGATVVAQTISTTSLTSLSLQNGVTYVWSVLASNSAGTSAASTGEYFTVSVAVPLAPTVSTGSASALTSNSATLGGTVNPNGLSTQFWFQYSTNNSLSGANQTPSQSVGSGSSALPISANIASLSANTTYYYRLQAQNSAGTNSGSILNFATSAAVPPTPTGLSPGGSSPPGPTVNTLTPILSWSASSGATQYSIALLNVSTGATVVAQTVSTTSLTTSALQNGVTYVWSVSASDSAGTSTPSTGVYFTVSVATAPPTPTGLSPGGSSPPGSTVNTLTPTLSWSASSGATQYSVAVLNVSTGGTVVAQTASTTSLTTSALQNGVTYVWSVSASNSAGTSAASTGEYFTVSVIVPQAPTVSTGSASAVTSNSATLGGTVNPNGQSTQFWLQYGTNSSLSGANQTPSQNVGSGSSALPISANIASLSANTTYYYRLQAQNSAGTSSGSILNFATIAAVPPTPAGLSPGGSSPPGTTVNTVTPTLSWSASTGATQYSVAVLNASTGSTVVAQTVSTTSLTTSALQNGVTYVWSVSASNSAGISTPSTGVYFTVSVAVPQAPTVTTGSASAVTSTSATLGGTANPNGLDTHYWFLYASNSSLSGAAQSGTYDIGAGTSALTITANAPGLSANTAYYYRLQAQNSAGTSSGNILTFSTSAVIPPTPTGLSPGGSSASGTTVNTLTPTLSWSGSTGATQYSVAVLNVSTGATVVAQTVSTTSLTTPSLTNGVTYVWSVSASNSAGTSTPSTGVYFTVSVAPAISGLSPSSYPVSGSNQTMLINGSNFQSGATVTFHDPQGNPYVRTPTFVSSSQLSHSFNDGSDAGTWTVYVTNPGGKTSNTWSFSVH